MQLDIDVSPPVNIMEQKKDKAVLLCYFVFLAMSLLGCCIVFPVDIFGIVVGESPDCLLLSGTVVGENPDHVCWVHNQMKNGCVKKPL